MAFLALLGAPYIYEISSLRVNILLTEYILRDMYRAAQLFKDESSSDDAVPTAATYSVGELS